MAIIIGYVGENGRDQETVVPSPVTKFSGSPSVAKRQMKEFAASHVDKKWIKYVMEVDDNKFYGKN